MSDTVPGTPRSAYPVSFDVEPQLSDRNRLTTGFRVILAIPHVLLAGGAAWAAIEDKAALEIERNVRRGIWRITVTRIAPAWLIFGFKSTDSLKLNTLPLECTYAS